jgi:HEAT repeat protein
MATTRTSKVALLLAALVFGSRTAQALPQEDRPAEEIERPVLASGDPCPQSLDVLIAFLKIDEGISSRAAAICLGETRDSRAVEPLVQAMLSNKGDVHFALYARDALREINDPHTADLLLDALNSKETRWIAALTLGDLQITRGVEPLLSLLKSGDQLDRRTAAFALGPMKDTRAIEALYAALKQDDEVLRRYAAKSLGEIGDARAVDVLITALSDPDDGVRTNAAESLGKIKDPSAVTLLAARFANADEERHVRMAAAESLGEIADHAAVTALIGGLKSDSKFKQWYSAKALAAIQQPEAVQAISESLKERNLNVVAAVYPTLIRADDPEFVPLLVEALNNSGDQIMAQDFANSENSQLADAARKYAAEKGFVIPDDSE